MTHGDFVNGVISDANRKKAVRENDYLKKLTIKFFIVIYQK